MDIMNDNSNFELPFEPPPIWPEIEDELREYIECVENLPIYHADNAQCYWPRQPDVLSLMDFDLAPVGTVLKFDRNPVTGEIGRMHEVALKSTGETPQNSMSMNRAPMPPTKHVTGDPSNVLFWPGGFDEPEMVENTSMEAIDFEKNLRTLAKGFSAGIQFDSEYGSSKEESGEDSLSQFDRVESESKGDKVNLMAIVHEEANVFDSWSYVEETKEETTEDPTPPVQVTDDIGPLADDVHIPVLKISEKPPVNLKSEWAEQLDISVPVTDFDKRIPNPAITFPYELDSFQKQAILKLEENCNVFVAAHTSAGKTTVAEYAIALSQKHMTKVIYTSPIKALSNQKYREFKKKFGNVGLLTGDYQINQTASCLIMTTEILQSMLYCAAEVLRDLEFVIFDEVHYINNDDRGHVWEESVILLPQNITIVMLSATVPNPLKFADWVGRIKKKKTYVISTVKRPVPLHHYLYTGTDGRTKDDKFLVLDGSGEFLLDGWYKAVNAKENKSQNSKNAKEVKSKTQMTQKQKQVMWSAFISHLKTNNMLPVVVFMFSRKGCDTSATLLHNVDFTTETEKYFIRTFYQNNIRNLKGTDRQLPQVIMMQELLQNGIGIHHSGILPILREIVEILFQSGVVKLLFATETFSMGVNMPARTVVFDSIGKYDGLNHRILLPTEYIQMAGRAGRRGHDTAGMVIIMCQTAVPHFNDLKTMMCTQPKTLESKFKVTYSMVLNLRRFHDSVSVEAMMRRSFKESSLAANENVYKIELRKVEAELSKLPPLTDMQKKLMDFYEIAIEYLEFLRYLKPDMLEKKKAAKSLTPGRILLISHGTHHNKLALLLSLVDNNVTGTKYKVLVLKNSESSASDDYISSKVAKFENQERWNNIVALTKKEIFVPTGDPAEEVLVIPAWSIIEITSCQLAINCDVVLSLWERQQIPRFKFKPPGPTYQAAIQELMTLCRNAARNPQVLEPYVSVEQYAQNKQQVQHLAHLKEILDDMKCTNIPNFEEQFIPVYQRSELENKKKKLQLKLSDEGLSLYPDYVNAVALLKELGYLDNDERVALKGRVALQMGSNELLITELILKNVLTVLQPEEIAALLSTLVFQQRTYVTPNIPPSLEKACEEIKTIYATLNSLEEHYQLLTLSPLNFGLVEVVYDWACAKSFAEIMEKTDVQEGIIVKCIQKLSETLRDVKNASVTIGDPVLKDKMDEASTAIKRDIVFVESLYTHN